MGSKPVRSKFFIFLEPGKKLEIFFFQEKSGFFEKYRYFIGKYRYLSENIGIYRKNRQFFVDFFTSDFSTRKSFPAPPKNRSKKPIFLSIATAEVHHREAVEEPERSALAGDLNGTS